MKKIPLLILLFLINPAEAIPPPDLIITAVQSAMQMFGVIVAFSLSAFFFIGDYIKAVYYKNSKFFIFITALFSILIFSSIYAYYHKFGFSSYQQNQEEQVFYH